MEGTMTSRRTLLTGMLLACARAVLGATLLVPGDYAEVADAVRAAQFGDVVRVSPKPSGEPYAVVLAKHKVYVVVEPDVGTRPVVAGFIVLKSSSFVVRGFDLAGGVFVKNGKNVIFDDLTIPAAADSRIIFYGGSDNAIRDSRVDSAKTAIQFLRSTKPLVRGNRVVGMARTGILITKCTGVVADDNVVTVGGRRAIHLEDSPTALLRDNTVTAAGNGIEVLRSPSAILDSNVANRNGRDGIVVASSHDPQIVDNSLIDNVRFGLLVVLSPPIDRASDVLGPSGNVAAGNSEGVVVIRVRLPARR